MAWTTVRLDGRFHDFAAWCTSRHSAPTTILKMQPRTRRCLLFAAAAVAVSTGAGTATADLYDITAVLPDGQVRDNYGLCIGAGCAAATPPTDASVNSGPRAIAAAPGTVVEAYDRFVPSEMARFVAGDGTTTVTLRNMLSPGPHPAMSAEEREFVRLVNTARTAEALQPLVPSSRYFDAADRHNAWMLRTNTMSHVGEFGSRFGDRLKSAGVSGFPMGEVVFLRGGTAKMAFEGFMNSPSHRAALMFKRARLIGVGADKGSWVGEVGDSMTQCTVDCGEPVFDPAKPSSGYDDVTPAAPKSCKPGFRGSPTASRKRSGLRRVRLTVRVTRCTPRSARLVVAFDRRAKTFRLRGSLSITTGASTVRVRLVLSGRTVAARSVRVRTLRR